MAKVEFHFDFGSPNAYLAHLVIPEIEQRTGAKFEYVPVLLGGVYKLTGNRSPAESLAGIKNKPDYERLETARFIKRHGITSLPAQSVLPGQYFDHHARRHRGAEAGRVRALCRRDLSAHVVGAQKARRSGGVAGGLARSLVSMPSASASWSKTPRSRRGCSTIRSARSRVALSARPPSSSATRSSSARTGCAMSRR